MSVKALPIVYINLGVEMIYILDQRLRAQNINETTSSKVIKEIISSMFEPDFIAELFKPCTLYSVETFKAMYEKLAHSSVMKLNEQSMTKLYELMIMSVKCEILNSPRPKDLMSLTLNHLDELYKMVGSDDQSIFNLLENAYELLHKTYCKLTHGGYMRIRNSMLTFFQDTNIRVSTFLQDKIQTPEGKIVVKVDGIIGYDIEVPGQIKYFHQTGQIKQIKKFDCGAGPYLENNFEGSFERFGKRGVKLGKNMYSISLSTITSSSASQPSNNIFNGASDSHAKAQLELLTNLIGRKQANKMKTEFKLNLFNFFNDDDDSEPGISYNNEGSKLDTDTKSKSQIVYVDAKKKKVPTATLR